MPVDISHINHEDVSDKDVRQYRQHLKSMTLDELNAELTDNIRNAKKVEDGPRVGSSYFLFARLAREERDARIKGMYR